MSSFVIENILSKLRNKGFRKIYSHVLNYGAGDVLSQAIGFLLIPLYTLYLTPKDYGILDLTQTITAFAAPFLKLGVPGAFTRFYYDYRHDDQSISNYVKSIKSLLNIFAIVVGSLLLIILFFVKDLLFADLKYWPYIVLAVFSAAISSNNQLQQKVMQCNEESAYSAKLKFSFSIVSILLAILFVTVFKMGVLGLLLAHLAVSAFFFIQAEFYLSKYAKGVFKLSMAKDSIKYGLGILPSHLAVAIAPLVNKSILLKFSSLLNLGIYSMALRFTMPLELLYSATTTAFIPIYNKLRSEEKEVELTNIIRNMLMVTIFMYAGFQIAGPLLMNLMLPENFKSAIPIAPILSLGFVGKSIYLIYQSEAFYLKKTKFISIVTILSLVLSLTFTALMVARYEVYAIAWASTISSLSMAVLSILYKRKVSSHQLYKKELMWFVFAAIIISVLSLGWHGFVQ